jgi:hypothetical protein
MELAPKSSYKLPRRSWAACLADGAAELKKKKGFICSPPPPPPISYSLKSSLRISLLLASTNQLASRTEQAKLFSDEVRYGPNFPFFVSNHTQAAHRRQPRFLNSNVFLLK